MPTRGHLVALWGYTCKCGNFSIPNNVKCLVICLNRTYGHPITTKLSVLFGTNNFLRRCKDIKFNIKLQIDGKEQISVASANTKEFAKQLGSAYGSMDKLSRRTFTFN